MFNAAIQIVRDAVGIWGDRRCSGSSTGRSRGWRRSSTSTGGRSGSSGFTIWERTFDTASQRAKDGSAKSRLLIFLKRTGVAIVSDQTSGITLKNRLREFLWNFKRNTLNSASKYVTNKRSVTGLSCFNKGRRCFRFAPYKIPCKGHSLKEFVEYDRLGYVKRRRTYRTANDSRGVICWTLPPFNFRSLPLLRETRHHLSVVLCSLGTKAYNGSSGGSGSKSGSGSSDSRSHP